MMVDQGYYEQLEMNADYVFNDEDDYTFFPPMSTTLANFLCNKIGVTAEFVREFEKEALVWNIETFMWFFSLGTEEEIIQRMKNDLCMMHPIHIT